MYTAFGLNIESEIELPELLTSEGPADITITLGSVPERIQNPSETTPWFEIGQGLFLLRVDTIAKYFVENGTTIIIEPDDQADMQDVRLFLLNTVIAALLIQRGYIALHGAAGIINGKAVAIVGDSGMGKSSLAMLFYDHGYDLLNDAICAIKVREGKAYVYPGIPQLNVWNDTLLRTNKDVNHYQPIRQGLEKYGFRIEKQFSRQEAELSAIIQMNRFNDTIVSLNPKTGGKKFERLMKNSFFSEAIPDKKQHFYQCKVISDSVRFYDLEYNPKMNQIDSAFDVILKELQQ